MGTPTENITPDKRKAQKKKLGLFITAAALSVIMLAGSAACWFGARALKENDDEDRTDAYASAELDEETPSYSDAIENNPADIKPYKQMIDAYMEKGSFGEEEAKTLCELFGKYEGDKACSDYLDLCYGMGFLFFNLYGEDGTDSFQTQVEKSSQYFEEIHSILKDNPKISFDRQDAAEGYYTVTSFYSENSGLPLEKEYTRDELSALLNAFDVCLTSIEAYDEAPDETVQSVKLDRYMCIANLINELGRVLPDAEIAEETAQNLLDRIERGENAITAESLTELREKALTEIDHYKKNISNAYCE